MLHLASSVLDLGVSWLLSGAMEQRRLCVTSILSTAVKALLIAVGAFVSCFFSEAVFAGDFSAKLKMSDHSSRYSDLQRQKD